MKEVLKSSVKLLCIGLLLMVPLFLTAGCSDDNGNGSTNHAPVVNSVTCSPTSLTSSGGTVTVTVSASDSDGDNLTYSYSVTGGTITGSGTTVTWSVPANSGTSQVSYTVSVSVSDGTANASGTAGVSVAPLVQETKVVGTLTLLAGQSGDLGNCQVALYVDEAHWNVYSPVTGLFVASVGSGASATYSISNVPAGTYIIDSWKDRDNSADWTTGDLVGWSGSGALAAPSLTPFSIAEGQTVTINMQMQVIP